MDDPLIEVARLLRVRNSIDARLGQIIDRPMTSGHLGEWLASEVFDIKLQDSAVAPGLDGHFRAGSLAGKSVNVKWYLKREGLLDTSTSAVLDYYLVMAGPVSAAQSSRGASRPWCIASVYLFDARVLRTEQLVRGIKAGTASSVRNSQWAGAEIYPQMTNTVLPLSHTQIAALRLFEPSK